MFELLCTEVDGAHFGELVAPFLFGRTFLASRQSVVDDILRGMKPTADSRAFMRAQARALQQFDGEGDARACRVRQGTLFRHDCGSCTWRCLVHSVLAHCSLHDCMHGDATSTMLASMRALAIRSTLTHQVELCAC